MATVQRTYNVPLRSGFRETARWKRAKKAMAVLRLFLQKHTKREDVKIGMHLNEHLWKHGIKNPPHHVKVDVWIEEDYAKAELSGHTFKEATKAKKKEESGGTLKDKLQAKLGRKTEEQEKGTPSESGENEKKPADADKKPVKAEKQEGRKETKKKD